MNGTDQAATPPAPPGPDGDARRVEPPVEDPLAILQGRGKSPGLAAFLAWLIPGAGHLYAGYPIKGFGALVLLLGMFLSGLLLSRGDAVSLQPETGHEYAFLAQVGAGLPTALGLAYSHGKLPGLTPSDLMAPSLLSDPEYTARLPAVDAGLLLTMVAGLLNLLLIHDALNGVPGAIERRLDERRRRERRDALRRKLAAEAAAAPAQAAEAAAAPAQAAEAAAAPAQAAEAAAAPAQAEEAP